MIAPTRLAAGRSPMRLPMVANQGSQALIDTKGHRAAIATVAAVGSAKRLELLAMDGGAAVAAVAAVQVQRDLVHKGGDGHADASSHCSDNTQKGGPVLGHPFGVVVNDYVAEVAASPGPEKLDAESDALGVTLTTRRPRRVPNSTWPATRANKVSSLPRPTPTPGWKWVPRCLTMISPAFTCWPPNRLTPSR